MSEAAPQATLEWHAVPVPFPAVGRTCGFEAGGVRLVLCNAEGEPYVLHDECPHVRVPLSGGKLVGTVLECPLHGGKIDVRDGAPAGLPIRARARCVAVRERAGQLEVGLPSAAD